MIKIRWDKHILFDVGVYSWKRKLIESCGAIRKTPWLRIRRKGCLLPLSNPTTEQNSEIHGIWLHILDFLAEFSLEMAYWSCWSKNIDTSDTTYFARDLVTFWAEEDDSGLAPVKISPSNSSGFGTAHSTLEDYGTGGWLQGFGILLYFMTGTHLGFTEWGYWTRE